MPWKYSYEQKKVDARTALLAVRSGKRIFLDGNCGEPTLLIEALSERARSLEGVEVVQLLALSKMPECTTQLRDHLRINSLFIGPGTRDAVNSGSADYTPVFLSEIPSLFRRKILPIDVAMIQVSPPDEHGFCSFGVSVDISKAAAEMAPIVIAQVNRHMPRTLGDSFIHVNKLTHVVCCDTPLKEFPPPEMTAVHREIGRHIASLIDDSATLQLGIGAIPNAVLAALGDHKHLGIHTEMFSDGVMELVEKGVIDNEAKTLHPGKIVSSFIMGSEVLYRWADNNPMIEMHPSDYTNDPFVIAQNENMVAINSAISVDLTGQVNSDTIGPTFYSGFGGQVDFIRGAARAKNGKPIIALPSMARHQSRIVPFLAEGAGVVTTRADVHYVVTEFGVAELYGKSIRDRARALINIADPRFREELESFAMQRNYI